MNITGRLWFRRIVLGTATIILLALIVHPVLNALIQTNDPAAELSTFEKAPIPDQENAARWLEAGAGAVVWSKEDKQVIGKATMSPFTRWEADLEERVRAVIENHRGAIATLNKAIGLDQSSYLIRYSQGNQSEVPDCVPLIWSARFLLVEARLGFGSCEPDEGFRATATLERLASTLDEESTIVTVLIGAATERMLLIVATEFITTDSPYRISNDDLERLD